jgi:hypothetical protein
MSGNERTRFCAACGLHVHNLSALSAAERTSLLRNAAGRICVTYQRRLDGEFVTAESPLSPRERTSLRQAGAVALSAAALALAAGCMSKPDAIVPPPPAPASDVKNPSTVGANGGDEEVIVLTGFFVEADECQQGYNATSTLAGTRRHRK